MTDDRRPELLLTVPVSSKQVELLGQLLMTGLYGGSLSECAERVLSSGLHRHLGLIDRAGVELRPVPRRKKRGAKGPRRARGSS
jgi:hypothetical protein